MVKASRGWRQGVKTYIAFEEEIDLEKAEPVFKEGASQHNEVYGICPDQVVHDPRWHKAGDLRYLEFVAIACLATVCCCMHKSRHQLFACAAGRWLHEGKKAP